MVSTYANRGLQAERLIELANQYYRECNIALIHKVPTEWKPLRSCAGQIVSAKVERKAAVDFLGVWKGHAVAFDVKETNAPWPLSNLANHQWDFLTRWAEMGGIAFVLVVLKQHASVHILTLRTLLQYMTRAANGGRKSITEGELLALPICPDVLSCPCHYLAAWQEAEQDRALKRSI